MGADYSGLGFDAFLRPMANKRVEPPRVTTFDFDSQYEISGKNAKLSGASIDNLVQLSDGATATSTDFEDGDTAQIIAILSPIDSNRLKSSRRHMGYPHMAIYEGTVEDRDNQIYPFQGVNIDNGDYECMAGWDLKNPNYDGIKVIYNVAVKILNVGTVDIMAVAQWQYSQNNFGQGTV